MTLPARIAGDLRSQIESRGVHPGDQLPSHRQIAATYGVSLGAAREAISILIGDGLVETRHGRGTYVAEEAQLAERATAPVTREDVQELIEAHELLGLRVVAMAAERSSDEHVTRLRDVVARMQRFVSDPRAYAETHIEFHLLVADAARNRFLRQAMHDLGRLMREDVELAAAAGIRRFGSLQYSVDAHAALVDAIDAGDPDAARRILSDLMHRHHEFVIGLFALAPPEEQPAVPRTSAPPRWK